MFRYAQARHLGALLIFAATACNRGEAEAGGTTKGGTSAAAPGTADKTGGGAAGRPGGPGGPGGGRPATVLGPNDVVDVKVGSIESAVIMSGDLRAIEEIAVRARTDGDLVSVRVREGDRVSRGQLLAQFESAVQEGDQASSLAERESAKSDVTNAQWNADQSAELFKAGAIPERDLRAAQQTLTAANARLAASEARLRGVEQVLSDTRIVSPTTGIVSTRTAETGERVTRGATLFTVVRNDVLELEASVPARQAGSFTRDRWCASARPAVSSKARWPESRR